MGVLPSIDSRPRLVFPNTPPESTSPGASTYSTNSSADRPWISPAPTSPSMNNYDKSLTTEMPADQKMNGEQSRPESTTQAAPRQQLPSLSSILDLHHQLADQHTRPFQSTTTLILLHLPWIALVRHLVTDIIQHLTSRPRCHLHYHNHAPTTTSSKRTDTQPMASHGLTLVQPLLDSAMASMPARNQLLKGNLADGSRDGSFRPPQDQFRLHFPSPKERVIPTYNDQGSSQGAPIPPPTPSTTATDGVPSKDGLGPKIWTGTHFLPRFVRATEVPGEGMCYFYDDGSHCKTVIDGEAVNAHWGVTKAGKPRKRLAIACVTCREKKIKCDPDYPRCVQCEKFGRVCKFKNAPRGGHNTSPSTPPAELDDVRTLNGPTIPNESENSSPVSPRTTLRPQSPESGSHKRLRSGYDSYVSMGEPVHALPPVEAPRPHVPIQPPAIELPRISEDVLNQAWRTDPSLSDPQSIRSVISHFFVHLDSTMIVRFIPENVFKAWVVNPGHRKTPEDLMILYSILAVGVALSGGPKAIAFEYASVAHYAQKLTTANCIQLVQTRVLLALYYISISRSSEASEMISAAVASAACLQLNVEIEESKEAGLVTFPFGMNKAGYCEARRRTFWSLYMLERLDGRFPDHLAMINAEDIYTRLPADGQSFEREMDGFAPVFNPYVSGVATAQDHELGISAYLVQMVHIWSNDVCRIYRMARRANVMETDLEPSQRILKRIQEWRNALPSRLAFTASNLESAALAGELGPFLTMHLLYNHAMIKLSRHTLAAGRLSPQTTSHNIQTCYEHATQVLDMAKALVRLHRGGQTVLSGPAPVLAMVLAEAVDVFTASGRLSHLSDIIENMHMVQGVVQAMFAIWDNVRNAQEAIDGRLAMLHRIRERGSQPVSPMEGYRVFYSSEGREEEKILRWQINNPMEKLYPRDMDTIYYLQ
ncbi:Zn(2)-C6 fungal-type DNA-binding domain [Fusarium oxysporum f. sp. vasinfectum]|nr:Zn(2)-C6 fungal-type DNA-binding domain [Fusarium oxysporum f. sp. vasinfectum]